MTNEDLLHKGRTLVVGDNVVWLVKGRIALVCCECIDYPNTPDKYALLFHNNERVGVVYFMGSTDIHVLTFPEHRSKAMKKERYYFLRRRDLNSMTI